MRDTPKVPPRATSTFTCRAIKLLQRIFFFSFFDHPLYLINSPPPPLHCSTLLSPSLSSSSLFLHSFPSPFLLFTLHLRLSLPPSLPFPFTLLSRFASSLLSRDFSRPPSLLLSLSPLPHCRPPLQFLHLTNTSLISFSTLPFLLFSNSSYFIYFSSFLSPFLLFYSKGIKNDLSD